MLKILTVRKCVISVLSFVLVFGLASTVFLNTVYGQEDEVFADVPEDHWAYDDVMYLAERGIITGLPGGTYEGDQAITRYQVANLVARTVRFLQDNRGVTEPQDLSSLENLVYELSERVDSATRTSSELDSRVNSLENRVQELQARTDARPDDYEQLVDRSQTNFIIGVTGILLGAGALAWAILLD